MHEVEHATPLGLDSIELACVDAEIREEASEHRLGVVLGRDRVVRAAVDHTAPVGRASILNAKLQRLVGGVVAELIGDRLVDRCRPRPSCRTSIAAPEVTRIELVAGPKAGHALLVPITQTLANDLETVEDAHLVLVVLEGGQ